jgi:hypothetical protein
MVESFEIRFSFKVPQDRPAYDQLKESTIVYYRLADSYAPEILWTISLGSD